MKGRRIAEIGRLGIHTFEIKEGSRKVFTTEKDIFPETGSREHYQTACFREVIVFFPCDETFRESRRQNQPNDGGGKRRRIRFNPGPWPIWSNAKESRFKNRSTRRQNAY